MSRTTSRFITKGFIESYGGQCSVESERFENFVKETEAANAACLVSVYPCRFDPTRWTCIFDTQFGEHRKANKDMPRMTSFRAH